MKHLKSILIIFGICLLLAACKEKCEHQYQSQVTKAASCSAEGEMTFSCTLCQDSYTEAIPTLAHQFSDPVITKEPTCAEEGVKKSTCTGCGETVSQPIEKLSHALGNVTETTQEAYCKKEGQGIGDCTVCGATGVSGTIPPNGNHLYEISTDEEPTCTKIGFGTKTCKICQYSETCVLSAKGHSYGNMSVLEKATCVSDGLGQTRCTGCGETTNETIPASGHKWTDASKKICSVCSVIDKSGNHTYLVTQHQAPSNTFAGYDKYACTTCGHTKDVYYVDKYTFDLSALEAEIIQHATAKGFKVSTEVPSGGLSNVHSFSLAVHNVGRLGTPESLVKQGIRYVDQSYTEQNLSPEVIDGYIMFIDVSYRQSGALGYGVFSVSAQAYIP